MNRVICVNGHFYDGDKYEACPHCAAGTAAIKQDPFSVRHSEMEEEKPKRDKHGLFHRKEKKPKEDKVAAAGAADKTVLLEEEENKSEGEPEQRGEQKQYRQPENMQIDKKQEQRNLSPNSRQAGEREQERYNRTGNQPISRSEEKSQSLSADFAASAQTGETSDEGKTVGYFSKGKIEPPTGYLICVAGEDYGMGFPLKTGNNSIGRSVSMDVVIMDEKVSREKQAFVMYEPRKREFYMKPGEGTGLCYLNGELVLEPVKMKALDLIWLGDTKLMLVPVCCEGFSWDEVDDEK